MEVLMRGQILSAVIGALVGGAVGGAVVFFVPGVIGNSDSSSGKASFETLEVGKLTIKEDARILNANGADSIRLGNGSIVANAAIVGNKFIGTQYQGSFMIANRMFTTPDDITNTPNEDWQFFTEIGSSAKTGGEVIVRSPNGAKLVGKKTTDGLLYRTGFDEAGKPQLGLATPAGTVAQVAFLTRAPASAEQNEANPAMQESEKANTPPIVAIETAERTETPESAGAAADVEAAPAVANVPETVQ